MTQPKMKLLVAFGVSALIHIVWILIWPIHLPIKAQANTSDMRLSILQLDIAKKTTPHVTSPNPMRTLKPIYSNSVVEDPTTSHRVDIQQTNTPLNNASLPAVYLSAKEVDIQALPINNIDAAMLPQGVIQNMPIKLRLFIDEFGHVARIAPLKSPLYQDESIEAALSQLLYKVSFTPAKRQGVDVKSYQDVAYDFNFYQASNHP